MPASARLDVDSGTVRGWQARDVTDRVPLPRTPDGVASDRAFFALYGQWAPLTPAQFAAEMRGFDRPWWVVGGWAVEAATGSGASTRTSTCRCWPVTCRPSSSSCRAAGTFGTDGIRYVLPELVLVFKARLERL